MKEKVAGKVLVWAVDPLDADTKPISQSVRDLAGWAKEWNLGLQPVFVLPPPINSQRDSLAAVDESQNLLNEFVDGYGIPDMHPPAVILSEGGTRQEAVDKLIEYARESDAAAIALSSHGRTGLQRFVLGSFAEQVLRDAPVPVFFLSKLRPIIEPRTMLFSTDFSTTSHEAFLKFLQFARPLKAEVVLFHAISLPAPIGSAGVAGPSAFIPENYFPSEEEKARKESAVWIREAEAAGVTARLQLSDPSIGLLTGEVIHEAADRAGAFLIALVTQSQPLEHFIFGSAAMDVFRASRYPVWICGPRALGDSMAGASPYPNGRATITRPEPPAPEGKRPAAS